MVSSSILASVAIFLLCFAGPTSLLPVYPEMLSFSVLLVGYLWGPRALVALLPVCWAVLSAAWIIEDRLAPELNGLDLRLSGIVCDVPVIDAGVQRFLFVIDAHNRSPGLPSRATISWYEAEPRVRAGERWQLTLRLKRPRGTRNPAGFDFERWAFQRNIGATGYVRHSVANQRLDPEPGGRCQLAAFRQRVATHLEVAIPDGIVVGHLLALAVGIRSRLEDHDWEVLRRTGTAHLMAISGLHIGLAAGFAFVIIRQIGRSLVLAGINCRILSWARAGALAAAVAYSALAGFSVPTVRAMVMTSAVIVLTALRRSFPPAVILAIALYAVLWVDPFAMLAPGFWLSFGAVWVLLLAGLGGVGILSSANSGWQQRFRQVLWAQSCLGIGLLPASAFFFGQVAVIAPLANLLVVPLFGLFIVPLLLAGLLALVASPWLAGLLLRLADSALAHIVGFLEWLNRWPVIAFEVPRVSAWTAGMGGLVAVLLIWPRPLPGRLRLIGLLLALATLATSGVTRPAASDLRVVIMDVGQGLAVLVQTSGHAVLFDTGPRYRRGDAGRSVVVPVLRHFGVTRLDRLIVSHGDADHVGGAHSVLAAYPQAEFLSPEPLAEAGGRFSPCHVAAPWRYDDVGFQFLHPGPVADSPSWSENDASCVLLVQFAGGSLLLPGDIERRAERWLAANDLLPHVSLVVAPHHGSRTSSTAPFVAATRPEYVVFSAGYRNQWGFPVADVRQRWVAAGACPLSTGALGALVFEAVAGGPLQLVKRYRLDEVRIWSEEVGNGPTASQCQP